MTTTTKERPILFSGPMVRAILDGRKTQTRRIMKPQPPEEWEPFAYGPIQRWIGDGILSEPSENDRWGVFNQDGEWGFFSPFGKPGDRLWVRETWAPCRTFDQPEKTDAIWRAGPWRNGEEPSVKWKPSIHMPRWASRIELEIIDVRVERLQAISREDAIAEGVFLNSNDWWDCGNGLVWKSSPEAAFKSLWYAINGSQSWKANPWVWVIEFEKI